MGFFLVDGYPAASAVFASVPGSPVNFYGKFFGPSDENKVGSKASAMRGRKKVLFVTNNALVQFAFYLRLQKRVGVEMGLGNLWL
jgi:hypothetical protein